MTEQWATTRRVAEDLELVLRTLQDYPALARALTDPATALASKDALVRAVFTDVGPDTLGALTPGLAAAWESHRAFLAWAEELAVQAAWDWAVAAGVLRQAIHEVFEFGQLVARDHEARAAITDRRHPVEARQGLVRDMVSATLTPPAVQVIVATVSSRRGTIDQRVRAFVELGAKTAGGRLATATVAMPLTAGQAARLGEVLTTRLGTTVILEEIVDPAVLGGVRIECGAEVIDSTLAARLETARREFA
ncbi:MAG: F0F1 ATP synthase subunit delta [Propionibacteriaceae bacterium]|jgi:F-type H+-transporting ATPase subunit delta|nr:F0F1 ATP synthase subunit delta [Propionibacteriaceae bacterium]